MSSSSDSETPFHDIMRLLAWAWLVVGGLALLASQAHAAGPKDVIEDVNSKQLDGLVEDSDYVAVFWCKCPMRGWGCSSTRQDGVSTH